MKVYFHNNKAFSQLTISSLKNKFKKKEDIHISNKKMIAIFLKKLLEYASNTIYSLKDT